MIQHTCPTCDAKLTNSDAAAGMEITCSGCYNRVRVPEPAAEPATDMALALKLALARAEGDLPPLPQSAGATPPSKLKKRLILAAVPVVAAGLAWLVAGHVWLWFLPGLLGAVFFGSVVLGLAGRFIKGLHRPGEVKESALAVGYMGLVLGAWFGVGWFFQVGKVHVDNSSGKELRVQVDGRDWLTCRSGTNTVQNLSPGSHRITVFDAEGRQVDELTVQVERQGVYVLNLLRAQKYHKGRVQYGGIAFGDDSPTEISDAWFDAKVDYLFEKPPQAITVSTRHGQAAVGTTKTYLLRAPSLFQFVSQAPASSIWSSRTSM
jgi:hypothetical protein